MPAKPLLRRRPRTELPADVTLVGRVLLVMLLGILGFRLHELVPSIARVTKPVMVIGPIALATIAMQSSRRISEALTSDRLLQLSLALVLWGTILVPVALVRGEALKTVQATLPLIALVLVLALLPSRAQMMDRLLSYYAICGLALGAAALLLGQEMAEGRVSVTESLDPNDLAAALSVSLMFALGLAIRLKGLRRLLYAVTTVVIVLAILRTGSRGGVLGVGAGLIAFVLASPKKVIIKRIIILGVLAAAAWSQAPDGFRERMRTLTTLENDYNTQVYGGRQQIWQRGIQFGLASPITGVGIGNFASADGAHMREVGLTGKWSAAHNSLVQAFAELGFPGLIIFLWICGAVVQTAFRASRVRWLHPRDTPRPELLAASAAYLVSAFFLSAAYSWATFSLIAIVNFAGRRLLPQRR